MTEPSTDPQPKRRWRALRWPLRGVYLLVILAIASLAVLAYPPGGRDISLPDWARARIEARMDAAMPGGNVTVGAVGIRLSRERMLPQIRFRDVALTSDGQQRIVLPQLSISVDPRAVLSGTVRPRHVRVAGAGLRLVRSNDGSLDLAFAGGGSDTARDLAETLRGIDAMFSQPVFSRLETVTAEDADLVIENAGTGDRLEVAGADLTLIPMQDALTLAVGGTIEGGRAGRLDLSFTRWAARGETEIVAFFENLQARDVASVSDALAWLDLIEAGLSGQMSTVIRDDTTLDRLTGSLQVGAGLLRPGPDVTPIALEGLDLSFDYDAATRRLQVEELDVASRLFSARIAGHADLLDGPVYVAQFQLEDIRSAAPGLLENPIRFEGGALDMRVQLLPALRVDLGQAVLFDDGLHLSARGQVAVEEGGVAIRLDASSPRVEARQILPLWPLVSIPNTRDWLEQNLLGGTISNLNAGLRLAPGTEPRYAVTFDFEDARVRALRAMAPVEDGRGYVEMSDNAMTLALHGGHVTAPDGGRLDLAGSTMRIADTRVAQADTHFDLSVAGSVPSALTLIAAEPLTLLDRFDYDPATVATGDVALEVALNFRMQQRITPADVNFRIGGSLTDVRSDQLVEGRVLRAERLEIEAGNTRLEIGGPARLDNLRTDATWSRALGANTTTASRVQGRATLSPAALADFGVILPDGMLRGQGTAEFTLDLSPDAPPALSLRSDLAGIGLAIPALGWQLPEAATGQLRAEMTLGPEPEVPVLAISGAGLEMRGAVTLQGTQFSQLSLDEFHIGDWMDVTGGLTLRDNRPLVRITGGTVDLRGLPQSSGGGATTSLPIEMLLDRLTVTDSIYLTDLSASIGGSPVSGDFRGRVGGQAGVVGSILAETNGMSLRLRAEDGGAVLRAAGIYSNAYGGALDLILRPHPGQGNYAGLLTIDNPRLRDAPAIAELLNLVSVVGLLEQMASGEGIALGEVRADFRISPRAITVVEGTAVGPSMGLSLDGVYDTATDRVDFQGVVSPFYVVNGLVGALFATRREGLFGFTYRMTGPADNSTVTVNPLSVFTPGIFREIFRSPPPQTAQ
jgi:hypothetical protein